MSFVIYVVTLAHRKINIWPIVDPHTFYPSEADRQNLLVDPNWDGQTQQIQMPNLTQT